MLSNIQLVSQIYNWNIECLLAEINLIAAGLGIDLGLREKSQTINTKAANLCNCKAYNIKCK